MDPDKLLVKVSLGKKLTAAEMEDVIHALTKIDPQAMGRAGLVDEAYSLLHLLGRAKVFHCIQLLEKYLESKDPLTVALVLEILCFDWGRSEGYIERVIDFALGVSWDLEEDVRQTAIKILGEYLRGRFESANSKSNDTLPEDIQIVPGGDKTKHVLELLFGILSDQELGQATRQGAYFALCRAGGKEWTELPSECAVLNLERDSPDLDWAMLAKLAPAQ